MLALTVRPNTPESLALREVADPAAPGKGEVRVKVLEMGICGTDVALKSGQHGVAPEGCAELVIGHENMGVVEALGEGVTGFSVGDLVVATVRRPCGENCPNCATGHVDFCSTGHYQERGIAGRDGYAAQFYVERTEYLLKLPPETAAWGILMEPMSVITKGLEEAWQLQAARMRWSPKTAIVTGAGPIGLLAALFLRLKGVEGVHVVDRVDGASAKGEFVRAIGAHYVDSRQENFGALAERVGAIDLIAEATGYPPLIFESMGRLGINAVQVLLGLCEGRASQPVEGGETANELVMHNGLVFGSVSANREHFEHGLAMLQEAERRWPGLVPGMISRRVPAKDYAQAFDRRPDDVKVVLQLTT